MSENPTRGRRVWVGLDTGVATCGICVIDENGKIIHQDNIVSKAAAIDAFLKQNFSGEVSEIAMESCSTSISIVRALKRMGYRAAMFDTAQVHKFISMRRNKTDLNDARGIAELSRFGRSILTEVFVKSTDCYAVRNNIVARNSVMKQRIATEGMMRSLLRLHGGRISVRIINAKLLRRHFENASRLVLEETGVDISASILPLISLAERIRAEIDRLDGEINAFAESNEVCRHFMEIPGVRALTAVSFYTAIEDPSRFRRSTDVSAYLGLTPKIHRSGENTRPNGISKAGNVMTRTHLVTAATVLLSVCKKEFELRRWGLDRAGVIGLPKARIAVARKLANMMFSMWRANARFEPWGPSGKNALIVPCGAIDGPQQDSVGQYRANDPALM